MTITESVDRREWDAYVGAHPEATAYHAWGWRRVFEGALGHETAYYAAVDGDRIVGVLPLVVFDSRLFGRFAVSLPVVNYGGVLADDAEAERALVAAAARLATGRSLAFVELRHRRRRLPELVERRHKVAMLLPLEADAGAMWAALDRKVRNQIRKAEKSGLEVAEAGRELLPAFYDVFARNMRDLGTPVWSMRFFEEALEHLGPAARVFVVRAGRTPIAGGISCTYRDTIEVPWASSLRAYRAIAPGNLLYWRVIGHAIDAGLRTLDFGRSTPGEGTFHYKKQWGAAPHPLAWEYWLADGTPLPDISPRNPKFRLAISTWKHLPVPITTWIGPALVRNIP